MSEPCTLCGCPQPRENDNGLKLPHSGCLPAWECPLVGRICVACCHQAFNGGQWDEPTALEVYRISGRSPQEAYATCKGCRQKSGSLMETAAVVMFDEEIGAPRGLTEVEMRPIENAVVRFREWLEGRRPGPMPPRPWRTRG